MLTRRGDACINPAQARNTAPSKPVARRKNVSLESADNYVSRRARILPIIFFEAFLTATLLLAAAGPWQWPFPNPAKLYGYTILCQCALLVGYLSAVNAPPRRVTRPISAAVLVKWGTILSFVMFVPTVMVRSGGNFDLVRGFTDPGLAYNETREAVLSSGGTLAYVEYVRMLLVPLIWSVLPLVIVYWKTVPKLFRVLALIAAALELTIYVSVGTNKGIVDAILIVPWMLLLRSPDISRSLAPKRILTGVLVLAMGLLVFVPFFYSNIVGRYSGDYVPATYLGKGVTLLADTATSEEGGAVAIMRKGMVPLSAYVTQGYYGLSLALEEPFTWTYGMGNSRILIWLSEKFCFGRDNVWNRTYIHRVDAEYGWREDNQWHTLYTWLASDVTFAGVPIILIFVGRILAQCWIDAVAKASPYAVVLFALLVIMICYSSANNQVLQTSDTFTVFWSALFLWLLGRQKRLVVHS